MGASFTYVITLANVGLNTSTGVTVSNALPAGVSFVSASVSQGTVSNAGPVVTAHLGSMAAGGTATISIKVAAIVASTVTDTAAVMGNESELDLSNNRATVVATVIAPPVIVTQPQSQSVIVGSNVTFSVSATGSLPLEYQWFFNGAPIPGATNTVLTLVSVRTNQAGTYTVTVSEKLDQDGEDVLKVTSTPATLNVLTGGSRSNAFESSGNGLDGTPASPLPVTPAAAGVRMRSSWPRTARIPN
jgi:uncharacterized repeat protein (TIGR01451 family)